MTREQYLKELRKEMRHFSAEEVEQAVQYCNEYFDEADSIEEAMKALGTPRRFAAQMKAERTINNKERRGSFSAMWLILLGVMALPVGIPVFMGLFAVIFAVIMAFGGAVVALVAVGIGLPVAAFGVLGVSIGLLFSEPILGLFLLGLSLVGVGFTLLIGLLIYWIIRLCIICVSNLLTWVFQKVKGRELA